MLFPPIDEAALKSARIDPRLHDELWSLWVESPAQAHQVVRWLATPPTAPALKAAVPAKPYHRAADRAAQQHGDMLIGRWLDLLSSVPPGQLEALVMQISEQLRGQTIAEKAALALPVP